MKFSVLMSVYCKDDSLYLRDAFNSILNQSLQPNQVVLIQDGKLTVDLYSEIEKFSNEFPNLNILKLEKNVGLGKALELGIELCENELVARCDADDINVLDRFKKQVDFFEKNPNVSVVGGQIKEFYTEGTEKIFISERNVPQNFEDVLNFSKKRNPLNHMTVMFKKDDILKSGNYKTAIGFEDYYLWLRVLKNSFKIENLPDYLVDARVGKEMIGRRGGFKYTVNAVKTKKIFLKEGLIGFKDFAISSTASIISGLSPKFVREFIYYKILYKGKK